MDRFLAQDTTIDVVRKGVASSKRAVLAVAFWGSGALREMGLDAEALSKRVRVICNLVHGGTNPSEIESLIEAGFEVAQCDRLHAKIYLFDDHAVVGSSNASANGLSFQGSELTGWLEANIMVRDEETLSSLAHWVENLPTRPIGPVDLSAAKEAWARRRASTIMGASSAKSVLDLMITGRNYLEGRGIYVAVYSTAMDKEGERGLVNAQEELAIEVDGFQSWPELPQDGTLICFWRGPRGGITFDGYKKRVPELRDRRLQNSSLQLCLPTEAPLGLINPQREASAWKNILAHFTTRRDRWNEGEGYGFIDLAELADAAQSGDLWL